MVLIVSMLRRGDRVRLCARKAGLRSMFHVKHGGYVRPGVRRRPVLRSDVSLTVGRRIRGGVVIISGTGGWIEWFISCSAVTTMPCSAVSGEGARSSCRDRSCGVSDCRAGNPGWFQVSRTGVLPAMAMFPEFHKKSRSCSPVAGSCGVRAVYHVKHGPGISAYSGCCSGSGSRSRCQAAA